MKENRQGQETRGLGQAALTQALEENMPEQFRWCRNRIYEIGLILNPEDGKEEQKH